MNGHLKTMRDRQICPDCETLANLLKMVALASRGRFYNEACEYSLQLLDELKNGLGVDPSPVSYSLLLQIFNYRGKKPHE